MGKSTEFDLDKYITTICEEADVDSFHDLFEGTKFSKDGLSINYGTLLRYVINQNWDPYYNPQAGDFLDSESNVKITDESKFKEFLIDFKIENGLVPKDLLIRYLKFAKKYLKQGLFISNIFEALNIYNSLENIASSTCPVLIAGETGTQKEILARIIHRINQKNRTPFKVLQCKRFTDHELYRKIFGHLENLSSGTTKNLKGLLEETPNGTLFLKGVNNLGPKVQEGLLSYLREGKYTRSNDTEELKSECRLIFGVNSMFITDLKMDSELLDAISKDSIFRFPLKYFRNNIPLIIYLQAQKMGYKKVDFPLELIKYWLTIHEWSENHRELTTEIVPYIKRYSYKMKGGDLIKFNTLEAILAKKMFPNIIPIHMKALLSRIKDIQFSTKSKRNSNYFKELIEFVSDLKFRDYIHSLEYLSTKIEDIGSIAAIPFLLNTLIDKNNSRKPQFNLDRYESLPIINNIKTLLGLLNASDMTGDIEKTNNHPSKNPVEEKCVNNIQLDSDSETDNRTLTGKIQNIWRKEGDIWLVVYEGNSVMLPHTTGMYYIGHLLANPNKNFSLKELDILVNKGHLASNPSSIKLKEEVDAKKVSSPEIEDKLIKDNEDLSAVDFEKQGEDLIDKIAIEEYKNRIKKLKDQLEVEKMKGNDSKASILAKEILSVEKYLKISTNKFGKPRIFRDDAEKTRKKISGDVRYSYGKIRSKHESLIKHLQESIKLGQTPRYIPNSNIKWDTDF